MLKNTVVWFSWRLFLSAFLTVFISEMGDKTQITTLLLAGAKPTYVLWVALGSVSALICTSFIEVIIGAKLIARFVSPGKIKIISGIVFLFLGFLLLSGIVGNIQLKLGV